jgi:hypothetical protein
VTAALRLAATLLIASLTLLPAWPHAVSDHAMTAIKPTVPAHFARTRSSRTD